MTARGAMLLFVLLFDSTAWCGERWEVQYFYDEDKSSLTLFDIAFPTRLRGLAVGRMNHKGNEKNVTVVTADGGKRWTVIDAPDAGHSLFCLDESACWMAGRSGIWFSSEGGRDWRRVLRERLMTRVYFTSRQRGWALGGEKKLFETRDGGRKWTPTPAAVKLKTSEERTVFHAISFADPKVGMIAGRSEPLDNHDVPIWMDTEVERRRERPTLSIYLETHDGGEDWNASAASVFGRVSEAVLAKDGRGLVLMEFDRYFQFPSELLKLDLRKGSHSQTLRRTNFAVTDIALVPAGPGYAAGYEPAGKLASAPIPGRLRVMRSPDLDNWYDMDVDYRAVARHVSVAAYDADNVWIATDTGMILRLVKD